MVDTTGDPHGVYLVTETNGKRHAHFGNHPIRKHELEQREYPGAHVEVVAIYKDREEAKAHKARLLSSQWISHEHHCHASMRRCKSIVAGCKR